MAILYIKINNRRRNIKTMNKNKKRKKIWLWKIKMNKKTIEYNTIRFDIHIHLFFI